jgi:hypothetical protein
MQHSGFTECVKTQMKTDFTIKGFHIDLRIQVMPMAALRRYVATMAEFGLNTLLIEWEATYPYDPCAVISNEYAYTREEVVSFVAYCARLGIDVIPLQQCFGHVEYILRHERFAHLRESNKDISQVCPLKENGALDVFRDLLVDVASTHPSRYIHIGGDETQLLGHCPRCRDKAQSEGKSKLYVDYFKEIAQWVIKLGRRPVLWADMLLKYPEAADQMPRESVFVDWNYGWEPSHFGDPSRVRKCGFELWGAAALRSHPDNHSLTCWETHFRNIRDFIPYARAQGYEGMVLTSWSTSGVYGLEWDQDSEIVDMHPTRRVYPLAGFRPLLAAYAESLQRQEQIEPEDFVKRYAAARFGLSSHQGSKLWQAMTIDATPIQPNVNIETLCVKAREARRLLAGLHPRRHVDELEHLKLMVDLRDFHARFKRIENEIQSPRFSAAHILQNSRALVKLLEESQLLDERFMNANRGFLYERALIEEAEARSKKLRKLCDRLTRAGRKPGTVANVAGRSERKWHWAGGMRAPVKEPTRVPSPAVAPE